MSETKRDELPSGWEAALLSDLALTITKGTTPTTHGHQYKESGVSFVRVENLANGRINCATLTTFIDEAANNQLRRSQLKSGDILYSIAGTIGRTAAVGPDNLPANTNQALAIIRGTDAYCSSAYLIYFLSSPRSQEFLTRKARGGAMNNVSLSDVGQIIVRLAPKREQERIVAELDKQFTRLDAAVAALKRVQANLKRYRAAVLKAACEGRLVPTEAELARREGRSYEPASELLKRILAERGASGKPTRKKERTLLEDANEPVPDRLLPRLPEGWKWVTMPSLGELNRGKSKHRPRDDERLYGGAYPFIQTGDVKRSGGYIRAHAQTYSESGLAQSRLWPQGTLCITIAANIAESGILTYPACFPDSVVGFSMPNHSEIVRFVRFFLETAKSDLSRFAPATAQKNINLEILSDLAVPLPPSPEQCRIVAEVERRLSVIDELEMETEADLKRAGRLRQAILKRAFEGKLVPQDPNDEPASVLLERIRAERAHRDESSNGNRTRKQKSPRNQLASV